MQINSTNNNQNFCALIKISKQTKSNIKDAAILSSLGTTSSGAGVMSSMPISDPAHHIHSAAKVVDGLFFAIGSGLELLGANCLRYAHKILKSTVTKSKIPS